MKKTKKNKIPVRIGYHYVGAKGPSHTAIMLWIRLKDKKKIKDRTTTAKNVRFDYDTEASFEDLNEIQKGSIAHLLLGDPSLYEYSFQESDVL